MIIPPVLRSCGFRYDQRFFFFSSRRRHTRSLRDWSSDVCSSDLCAELAGEGTEASHLSCIVRAAGDAHRTGDFGLVAPSLFAYAHYLEQESHFEEAEDALETMINIGGGRLATSDTISAWLRLGRVRRKKTDFD